MPVSTVTGNFAPTRQLAYSLHSSPTRFHVVNALTQLYMYSKNSVITIDTAAVNPFNASCSKLLLFEGFSAILV